MIRLNYHHGNALTSKLIRVCSGDFFNHVSIQVDGWIYEAHIDTGVRKVKLEEWDDSTVYKVQDFHCSPKKKANAVAWLEKQVGKAYDLLGLLSYLWIFLKQKKGKWYCSELSYVFLMKCFGITSSEYSPRKTPQQVYEIGNLLTHFL